MIVRAIAKELTWIQAAAICGITARQMRRVKRRYEQYGYDGLVDGRGGKTRRKRIPLATLEHLCQLRREQYADFSAQHLWEKATELHERAISYTWAKLAWQAAGLADKSLGRGRYRRRRERRPLRGMMLHLDGSGDTNLQGLHEVTPLSRSTPSTAVQESASNDAASRYVYGRTVLRRISVVEGQPSFSAGTRLPFDRVRIVEANQPFTIRSVQRQRIFDPMRPFLAHWNTANDEPNPMSGFRVDHQHLW